MNLDALVGKERRCKVCGKVFIIKPEWVYKKGVGDGTVVFCSWGCLRKWESRRKPKGEQREAVIQAIRDGLTIREICDLLSVDSRVVYYWTKKLEEEKRDECETEPEGSSEAH